MLVSDSQLLRAKPSCFPAIHAFTPETIRNELYTLKDNKSIKNIPLGIKNIDLLSSSIYKSINIRFVFSGGSLQWLFSAMAAYLNLDFQSEQFNFGLINDYKSENIL